MSITSTMSIQSLPTETVCHILSFLDIKDHINFSTTCWGNYLAYGIHKINTREDVEKHINTINRYTVLHDYDNNGDTLGMVVGLCTSEYAGSTAYVKDLVVKSYHRYIHGNTIRHTPGSLSGCGLKYLVRLEIDYFNERCTISNVKFERLITLKAYRCNIINCKFDTLENLDLLQSEFLSEIPTTIKTLRVQQSEFSEDCVKEDLINLTDITSEGHDFIYYAPNVKRAELYDMYLYTLPETLEYLKLADVKVYGEEFYLPNLKELDVIISKIDGCIIVPRSLELTIYDDSEIFALVYLPPIV